MSSTEETEPTEDTEQSAKVSVRNLGGIESTTVDLPPGVTVLTGRNATNRTSFLRATMGALGSDAVSLKADSEDGEVTLTLDGSTYTRTLTRENGTVVRSGDPYLDEPGPAETFAFLLESNEARRAIRRGDDLRELIMRPVDTEAIQSEIAAFREERNEVESRLEQLESLRRELPELEAEREVLTEELETKREALAAKREEIEAANTDLEESRNRKEETDEQLDELRAARKELERVRFRIDSQEESLEALQQELDELESSGIGGPDDESTDLSAVESEITQLRERRQQLDGTVNELQSIIGFNEEMLDGDTNAIQAALDEEGADGAVTDQLVGSSEVVCWTCGTEVEKSAIESTVDRLRSLRSDLLEERNEVKQRLTDRKMERDRLEEQRRNRRELEQHREELREEIERRETQLVSLREQREDLMETIDSLESTVEESPDADYSRVIELHREANQLEVELEQLEEDREELDDRIDAIDAKLAEEADLESRREALSEQLADLRTRVEQIEKAAVEQFNTHMESILELLDYDNLERIWIERLQREITEGRQKSIRTVFELHVVRQTEGGTAYEDTVDHLSESEREVTGLVFALAGYLVHDVHETVPFMLLDSLEAIDADRIAALVEYLESYADYLVVALLPEDAAALSEEYTRITEI
ncbi:archaea-specific SMC-related protein [Natronomonas sp. EA1]|uniref:archaea-specific SMC-related protein n=1 Tax=Natronomonas sp. EA1 TaxID=3421655 RepID=UPI003EBB5B5B